MYTQKKNCAEFFSGDVCAEFASGEFVHKCARENLRGICVRILGAEMCGGILCRFARGSFARSVRRENVRRTFVRECGGIFFFSGCARSFFSCRRCARGCFRGWAGEFGPENGRRGGRGGQKGPKRAKNAQNGPKWPKMAKKGGGAQKGPKMAHFVPEWYTSGSGATAFDSTGWQKSPEYALIRIAAGPLFPPGTKVADLPKWQKSPILAPPESRRFRPGWQKSPISPPSESGASSVARSLLEKLSARLSPSSQSLHGRLLTDSRGGRARVAHVTCATVTHAHAPHSLKTPVRVYDCAHPHTPHTSHPHTPHTHPTHSRTRHPTQRHNVTTLSHGRHRRGIAHIKVLLCV